MIVRKPKTKNFSTFDNRVFEDPRISFRAKGVIALVLTKPDGWEVMPKHLEKVGPDGRVAIESALAELRAAGYMVTEKQPRGERGRFHHDVTVIYEEPTTGFPQVRKTAKAQLAPMSKTDNGEEAQVAPKSVIRGGQSAVDDQHLVKTEEAKTELGRKSTPSCPAASGEAGRSVFSYEDPKLNFSCQALSNSILELFPNMNAQSAPLLVKEIVQKVRDEAYDPFDTETAFDDQTFIALAAITERLDNREWRIGVNLSDPVEKIGFVMGVANQVIENYNRCDGWKGSAHRVLGSAESWDEFVFDHPHVALAS